jgi:hypothetical protein
MFNRGLLRFTKNNVHNHRGRVLIHATVLASGVVPSVAGLDLGTQRTYLVGLPERETAKPFRSIK